MKEIIDTFPNTHSGLVMSAVVIKTLRKEDRSHRYSRYFPRGLRSREFHVVKESWHKKSKRKLRK